MLAVDADRNLVEDAVGFVRHHALTARDLLRSYPRDAHLAEKYLELLALLVSHRDAAVDHPDLPRWVSDVVFRVAAFPLPEAFLPPLPTGLLEWERRRWEKLRQAARSDDAWWDSPFLDGEEVALPGPPTGTVEVFGTKLPQMTRHKYAAANRGARCVELGLLFLKHQMETKEGTIGTVD